MVFVHVCMGALPRVHPLKVPEKMRDSQERISLMVSEEPTEIWVLLSMLAAGWRCLIMCNNFCVGMVTEAQSKSINGWLV